MASYFAHDMSVPVTASMYVTGVIRYIERDPDSTGEIRNGN